MSQYKFITVESSNSQALPTSSLVRSHAIRAGLQQGSSVLRSQGARQSKETVKQKTQLKGRFRLSGAAVPFQSFGSSAESAEKATTQLYEQPSAGSSEVWRYGTDAFQGCDTHALLY